MQTSEPIKLLVLGATGLLGSCVLAESNRRGWSVDAPSRLDLDITSRSHLEAVPKRLLESEYSWVVNCGAYTQVDLAESEVMSAMSLNSVAPGTLAAACAGTSTRLLHLSTDFVFDGESQADYREDHPPRPINVYGRSKWDGEKNVQSMDSRSLVVRTAWLYGPSGKCFPRSILNAAREGRSLRVVADQVGSPTYAVDLARVLLDLMATNPEGGIYHAVGPEAMSWHGFAERIVAAAGLDVPVESISSEDWPTPARRPRRSVLSTEKLLSLGIAPMRPVDESLAEFLGSVLKPMKD